MLVISDGMISAGLPLIINALTVAWVFGGIRAEQKAHAIRINDLEKGEKERGQEHSSLRIEIAAFKADFSAQMVALKASLDRLVDQAWGDRAPRTSRKEFDEQSVYRDRPLTNSNPSGLFRQRHDYSLGAQWRV